MYIGILAFALVLLIFLGAGQASAEDVSGDISVDTTWYSGHVYNVTGDVTVLSNATLTIQENVTVVAENYLVLWVDGSLVVQGTADLPVTFTYNHTVIPIMSNLWYGISFNEGSNGSVEYANFDSTRTAMFFGNVIIPVSNININTTEWGMGWNFYGIEQNISLSVSDISIRNGGSGYSDGFEIWNHNGSLDLTLERVSMDNVETIADIIAVNAAGTGSTTITVIDSQFNNTNYGIEIDTNNMGDIELIDSQFTNIDDYVFWLDDDSGDKIITLDGVTIDDCYGGIYYRVEFGNVDMTITDSMLSGEDVLVDIIVNSNMLTNGFINLAVTNTEFSEADYGIRTLAEEMTPIMVTDSAFINITYVAMQFTVGSNDLTVTLTNDTIMNSGTGLFALVNDGSLDLSLMGVHFDTINYGARMEVSSLNATNMSSINMEVMDSVIEGGMYGIEATSVNGGNVLISGSEFLGQSEISYNFDSTYGNVDVEIVDSVFDGSSSETAGTVYTVEQLDPNFQLYGRNHAWDGIYFGGGEWVELPFTFEYNGLEMTDVYFSEEGYLDFGPGSSIRPIGNADLEYYGDHFFGYIVADDESYVLFNWYAMNYISGEGASNSFQVILYANGEIQFNFAAMDGYGGSNAWGLLNSNFPNIDYNMYQLFEAQVWYMDWTSFLFTPHDLSRGMGILVRSEVGDVDFVLNNNTITSYYRGGVFTQSEDGNMVFTATENSVSYMYAQSDLFGSTGVIVARAYNGTINANIVNNSFVRLWSPAVFASATDCIGGEHSFEVTGNEFVKTFYGVFTYVDIINNIWNASANEMLSVQANFQNNTMTDSFGLANEVWVETGDEINWNISVEQNFVGNVMTQVWYEGAYPLQDHIGYPGSMIIANLYVDDYQSDVAISMTVEHLVTITDNEMEQAVSGDNGIEVDSDLYKAMGDVDNVCSIIITDNVMSVWSGDGVDVETAVEAVSGTVNTDTSVVIEDNQITDDMTDITGIEVTIEGMSYYEEKMALDMNAVVYVSITGNVIEGAYESISVEIDHYQDNTVGDWAVNVTAHIDGNQLLGVIYGVYANIEGGVWFGQYYWPLNDEVAVGTFVMDYLLTIDDNTVSSILGMGIEDDGIFHVGADYWADVDPSTHFTEAYATVNGEISVSGNEVTQYDGYLTLLYLDHSYSAEKTGVMDVNVDIVVEDNTYDVLNDGYGLGPGMMAPEFGMLLVDNVELYGEITTDEPTVLADVSWSVTGNDISGPIGAGIAMVQGVDIDSPGCHLVQGFSVDISGNTVDGAIIGGLGYMLDSVEVTQGYVELNINVDIEDNTVVIGDGTYTVSETVPGIMVGFIDFDALSEDADYTNVNIDVLVSGNTISGATVGMALAMSFEDDDELAPGPMGSYQLNYVVENNHIMSSYYGISAYGGEMTLRNNVIEDCEYGIQWTYANGEITGNTITAIYGIEIDDPYQVLVQGNDVTYVEVGVYVDGWDEGTDVQILDNVLACDDLNGHNEDGDGVEIYDAGNVLVSGNIITDSYWGVYVDDCYNLTVSDNQILRTDYGIEMYDVEMGWIESNLVTDGYDGVYIGEDCRDLVIGNNTITNNLNYGLCIDDDGDSDIGMITLFNNEIVDNGYYGVYTNAWNAELVWYVDSGCTVARNDVDFDGDIIVMAGGSMMVEDVHEFEVDTFILVDEGGLFSASNTNFYGWGDIEVNGAFWANVCLFDGFNIYLGPTSEAEIRGGAIMNYDYAGVNVDGCAPVIADNLIFSTYAKYGILVEGEGANPSIVSNIIALNDFGVYARGTDMGGVYDNLIILNTQAGILAEEATGKIHDNILLVNKIEILLRNSNVSVEDNEIGYTDLFQVLANYAPLLGHIANLVGINVGSGPDDLTTDEPMAMLGSVLGISDFDLYDLATWVKGHNGIWAEGSEVWTSGNVYGMLNYALYSVRSEIHFADDIRTIELTVPHSSEGVTYTYSLDIYVLNGIFASGSQLWVDGSTIEVLDDGLMLDNTQAWVEGATLMAGDFDYFLYNNAEVYNIASTYGKCKVEDSHSLNEGTWLTLHAVDDGEPAANVSVIIKNAKGDIVYQGVTDAEGKIRVLLAQYSTTSQGKDDGFNPYSINATFESGVETMELTLNESYMDATITGEKESDMGPILVVVGVLVIILLIVAAVVVMRRRK